MFAVESENTGTEETLTPQEKAFGNELLLDKILSFVIYDAGGLSHSMLACCKLVRWEWWKIVNVLIQKDKTFRVFLSTNREYDRDRTKRFLETFAGYPANCILPFKFTFTSHMDDTFSPENLHSCVECFQKCGGGLRELEIDCLHGIPNHDEEPSPFFADLETVTLRNLEILSITETCRIPNYNCSTGSWVDGRTGSLLQWIVSGCECLRQFNLTQHCMESYCESYLEVDVRKLALPATVTEAVIASYFGFAHWDKLLHGKFDNLTKLIMLINYKERQEIVDSVIHRFHKQLQHFEVKGGDCFDFMWPVALEKLSKMPDIPVDSAFCAGLGKLFPVLKNINFNYVTYEVVQEVLECSKFPLVEDVAINLIFRGKESCDQEKDCLSQMIRLKSAFPNITRLHVVTPHSGKLSPVKYIFEEMTQLQTLSIHISYSRPPTTDRGEMDILSACFLGIKLEDVSTLQQQRDNWENVNLSSGGVTSIRDMQELREISLTCGMPAAIYVQNRCSNIDAVVNFGFLPLKPLHKLYLDGYTVYPSILAAWKAKGGTTFSSRWDDD